jgi:peptidoglycan/LPS O-acetylase OafA/YrhL
MLPGRELSHTRNQIDALDGFRGVAVLMVLLSHTSNSQMPLVPYLDFSGIGRSGVYLFFVLSSFLLTYPFLSQGREAFTKPFLANYFLRRFLRVYPLYIGCLLVSVISTALLYRLFDWSSPMGLPLTLDLQEFFGHLFLQQGKSVSWSISVEFRFYFLLPALAWCFVTPLRGRLLPGLCFTVFVIAIGQFFWPQADVFSVEIRLAPYMAIFLTGSFLALCQLHWDRLAEARRARWRVPLRCLGGAIALVIMLMTPALYGRLTGQSVLVTHFHTRLIEYALLWSVLIFAVVNGGGPLRWLFETRILRYFGFISFSMYLSHLVFMAIAEAYLLETGMAFVAGWLVFGTTVAVSHLLFILIEKPCSRIRYPVL